MSRFLVTGPIPAEIFIMDLRGTFSLLKGPTKRKGSIEHAKNRSG